MLFKFIFIVLAVAVALYLMRGMAKPSEFIPCDRCDGKGFWYAVRGKEICTKCRGEGTMRRDDY
jgi:RecJ-like exonuclease